MPTQLPRDLRSSPTYRDVEAFLLSVQVPGEGRVVDATDPATAPDGGRVAYTAWRRDTAGAAPTPVIEVVDTATGSRTTFAEHAGCRWPRWSPDGGRLLCLRRGDAGSELPVVIDLATRGITQPVAAPPAGTVEAAVWSPAGTSLALVVAEVGAEISDVFGSGRVTAPDEVPAWCPEVAAEGRSGWRRLWLCDLEGGDPRILAPGSNVWEVAWAGPQHLVAVASRGPEEDAWYDAELVLVDAGDGTHRTLLDPQTQLAMPAADPSGRRVSVLSGSASDRGLLAGEVVVVETATGSATRLAAAGVHVTSQSWRDENRLLLAGLRGHQTVVGTYDLARSHFDEDWATTETFGPGDLLPVAAPHGTADAVVVLESHRRPPTLGLVRPDGFRALADLAHDGTALVASLCDALRAVTWRSADGLEVDGYLATPAGGEPGPRPLVVLVHGGPVWRWRDTWVERTVQVPLLLRNGYAVLLPNPRGSQGRGESFVRAIVGEVGGRDVDDVVGGVDLAVALGVADPAAVGVMGTSYGGFLAAWLATTGRFAAAIAASPVTDWVSQHFTTNIPQSDVRFLVGPPLDPASQYRTRSPVVAATGSTCPVLLTAGQLDLATPPGQAVEMYRALVELGVDADLALYPREGHDVHEWPAVVDHCTRMLLWFGRHLGRPSGPDRTAS